MIQTSHKYYRSLTVKGVSYSGTNGLTDLATQLLRNNDAEDKNIGQFILDWINPQDFICLTTSGSTGAPKPIKVKKDAMLASARQTLKFLQLQKGDTALLCLSAKYIAGKMMIVRAMVGELNLFITNVSSNPLSSFCGEIDFVAMVPLQVSTILKHNIKLLNRLRHLIIGGGVVSREIKEQMKFVSANVWETYGMTETVSHIAMRSLKNNEPAFRLLPGYSISVDSRSCLVVEPSDVNELQLKTNDIIELNTDGTFVLKGRYDTIINSGGVKVLAEEVESKLAPIVFEKYAISWKTDAVLGQKVVLVCEIAPDKKLEDFDFSGLSKYETPREVICVKRIPTTETGKIQRKKLQQLIDN